MAALLMSSLTYRTTTFGLCGKNASEFTAVPTSDDDEPLKVVEQVVKDFHGLDKHAVALRYSKNKNGRVILLPDKPIDLENVQRVMEAPDNFFKGADGLLADIQSPNVDY